MTNTLTVIRPDQSRKPWIYYSDLESKADFHMATLEFQQQALDTNIDQIYAIVQHDVHALLDNIKPQIKKVKHDYDMRMYHMAIRADKAKQTRKITQEIDAINHEILYDAHESFEHEKKPAALQEIVNEAKTIYYAATIFEPYLYDHPLLANVPDILNEYDLFAQKVNDPDFNTQLLDKLRHQYIENDFLPVTSWLPRQNEKYVVPFSQYCLNQLKLSDQTSYHDYMTTQGWNSTQKLDLI